MMSSPPPLLRAKVTRRKLAQKLSIEEDAPFALVVGRKLGRLCELGLIFCCVALFISLVLVALFSAHARAPEGLTQQLRSQSRVFSNVSQSGRFSNRAMLKELLLGSLLRGVWRGRYATGRLRLHSLPSDFPHKGRLRVDSLTWGSSNNRFFARVSVRAIGRTGSTAREQIFRLSGEAVAYMNVVTTRRALLHGTTLTSDDLEQRSVPVSSSLKGALSNVRDALGKEASFRLRSGTILRLHHLRPARMVRRHSMVNVAYNNGGVRVVLQARALENGVKGELVRLRNSVSGNEFHAVVVGPGQTAVYQAREQAGDGVVGNNSFEHQIGPAAEQKFADDNPFRSVISR